MWPRALLSAVALKLPGNLALNLNSWAFQWRLMLNSSFLSTSGKTDDIGVKTLICTDGARLGVWNGGNFSGYLCKWLLTCSASIATVPGSSQKRIMTCPIQDLYLWMDYIAQNKVALLLLFNSSNNQQSSWATPTAALNILTKICNPFVISSSVRKVDCLVSTDFKLIFLHKNAAECSSWNVPGHSSFVHIQCHSWVYEYLK